ncbi:MAG: hypothetical protein ACOC2U_01570 [bacterium]
MNPKIVGLFGFPGSGKSSLSRSLSDEYNVLFKDLIAKEQCTELNGFFDKMSFKTYLYENFSKNKNFLMELMMQGIREDRINVFDAITTLYEHQYLANHNIDYTLVGIWAPQKDRIKRIVKNTRIQPVNFDEPINMREFYELDKRVLSYFINEENTSLFQVADQIISNTDSFEVLQQRFYDTIKK